ncbi:MAG TPA: DUF2911 domain-containing protein [Lacunisphaera sp.]|nr:DUF2911 domain-containing protein [Lacunisphaera sp.]
MNLLRTTLTAVALAGASALLADTVPAPATPRARVSPHETISARIDGNRVTIVYGRPYTKDPKTGQPRKIWGSLVPYGKVWRTGADEATLLITQQPLDVGGTALPAGTYTLYTLPAEDGSAQLLVNKLVGQWGADPYDAAHEFARIPLKKDTLATPVDQFIMALDKNPAGGGVLKLAWEDTQYSVGYTVKK